MRSFIKVMKAMSDPNRVKIMKMLQHRVMCVCEIQAAIDLSQSSVSKHLKILEEAGLTTFHKNGLWVNYTQADGTDSPYAATLMGQLKHWLENDPEISELYARLPDIQRERICADKKTT